MIGRKAEQKIAALLSRLPADRYVVLQNIRARYGDIDHLVIAKGAIFLIESKSQRGKVSWNGRHLLINGRLFPRNPISQVSLGIQWIRHMARQLWGVSPWIVAVLVFPNAQVMVRRPIKQVNVMTSNRLIEFICSYQQ